MSGKKPAFNIVCAPYFHIFRHCRICKHIDIFNFIIFFIFHSKKNNGLQKHRSTAIIHHNSAKDYICMEHRQINENYRVIAEKLIAQEPALAYIKDSRVKITYLESDSTKKDGRERLVLGECEKVAAKNRWAIPSDFTITLFRNNLVGLSEEQIKTVMFHELLHVGIEPGADGEETYSVRKHDLEDFKEIIDRYGTDWASVARKAE